jgi:hypothetical protein
MIRRLLLTLIRARRRSHGAGCAAARNAETGSVGAGHRQHQFEVTLSNAKPQAAARCRERLQ